MAVVLKADALATITLRAHGAHADLVDLARISTARHEVAAAAEIVAHDPLAVELVESEPPKDVGGQSFGSGFFARMGYSGLGHEAAPSWSGPRGAGTPAGPFLYLTPLFSHITDLNTTIIVTILW